MERGPYIQPVGAVPSGIPLDLSAFLTRVKAHIDISHGQTGPALDRTVHFRDLAALGVDDKIFTQLRPSSTRITRITASAVRTGKLESSDSSTFFDLDEDKLVMGGKNSYGSAITGIFIGKDGYSLGTAVYKINIGYDASNFLKFDGSKILIKAANFELDSAGKITAAAGNIGGWDIQTDLLRSAASGVRMELNQAKARISIFDAVNEKVAMGYLADLPKNDESGNWGVGDYGFWARKGDKLRIDGAGEYINGDWIVKHDAAYLIQDAAENTIVRLGTDTGEKGLFIYDTEGNPLAKYVSDGFLIGDVSKTGNYIEYANDTGALTIKGSVTVAGGGWSHPADVTQIDGSRIYTGSILAEALQVNKLSAITANAGSLTAGTIVGLTIMTSAEGKKIVITSNGIVLHSGAVTDKYNNFKYGDGTKYGDGVLAYIHHNSYSVPFYINAEQIVADFHFFNRAADPTGAAEIGDICMVNGVLRKCTAAGTPGTWGDV